MRNQAPFIPAWPVLWLLTTIALLALAGCGAPPAVHTVTHADQSAVSHAEHAVTIVDATVVESTPTVAPPAATAAPADAVGSFPVATPRQERSGAGEGHSEPIALAPGLALFEITHASATPIAIFLLNAQGEHLALLANGARLASRQVTHIPADGRYTLHVMAQDPWSVAVSQPAPAELERVAVTPGPLAGAGSDISAPLKLDAGELRVRWSHQGAYPATLALWGVDGRTVVALGTNDTSAGGDVAVDVPAAGVYLLDVLADGDWTVSFP